MDITLQQIELKFQSQAQPLFRIPDLVLKSGTKNLILGPSGIGKSTFLHLIAGLLQPTAGQLKIGEFLISEMSEKERSLFRRNHVGLVFQRLNLLDHLTAIENVTLGLFDSADKIKEATRALTQLNLENKIDQMAGTLSLGEQQRVAVARVLAAKPSILIADEPTSSLDETNTKNLIKYLFQRASQQTLIVVSHDLRLTSLFENVYDFSQWRVG